MKKLVFFSFLLLVTLNLQSQDTTAVSQPLRKFNIGLGAGMDYGGFGTRITVLASEKLEFFGALGYNILGVGVNAGADLRLAPKSRICPYLGAMYGYNAVIKITGTDIYNQTYYGPTFNFGIEFWSGRKPSFFNLELLLPIRSKEFHDDITSLKNNPAITFKNDLLPIGIGLGFHFAL
jgi:hypothetical protein